MVLNKARGILNICAIKSPGFGDRKTQMMEDLAILTGGSYISTQKGMKLEKLTIEMLGNARTVTIEKDKTVIVDGAGDKDAIQARFKEIEALHEIADSDYEKQQLKERMNRLAGGVAIINIGASSEVELKEKKDRVDDALHATRAAVEEGIVIGGGMALIRAHQASDPSKLNFANHSQELGGKIVFDACKAPFLTITENAGKNGQAILATYNTDKNQNSGYDARNDKWVDMFQAGIIDPTKVTRTALEMATSVAGTLLTTACVVSIEPEKDKKQVQEPAYDY